MKLKRLDIHGFKSFYHRTTLVFDEGITAVVGPNGCGKSNIVDSIKWVMGEQGPRSLRSGSMEDVVFNGSERRGPLGMCDVTLTFDNEAAASDSEDAIGDASTEDTPAALPLTWRRSREIAIERRLERGRGSDYLVNKTRCRLGDVQELIAGTGVASGSGRRAYAIIEQGQIGRVVSAKADERRALIEEAAGITRYRARRREAERKMEGTRANLDRVTDIVSEVETQLRTLRRQAKKAERYREYKEEARRIALRIAAFEFLALAAERSWLERELDRATQTEGESACDLDTAEARVTACRVDADAAVEVVRDALDTLRGLEHRAERARSERDLLDREVTTLAQRIERAAVEGDGLVRRRDAIDLELAESRASLASLDADVADDGAALERLDLAHRAAQEDVRRLRTETADQRRHADEESAAVAKRQASLAAAEQRYSAAGNRLTALRVELEPARIASAAAEVRIAEAGTRVELAKNVLVEARVARETAAQRRAATHRAVDGADRSERAAREACTLARSRLASLEELEARREGYGEGAKAALTLGPNHGVRGPVIECFAPPAELEKAVAAALGERLRGVVVVDADAARGALEYLRENKRGHGTFAVEDWNGSSEFDRADRVSGTPRGDAHSLAAMLDGTGSSPGLQRRLLGDTLVCDDVEVAIDVMRAPVAPAVAVTRDGDRVERDGIVTGGHEAIDVSSLGRRREIRELGARVTVLDEASTVAAATLLVARNEAQQAADGEREAGRALHRAELALAETRSELKRHEAEQARAAAALDRLERDAALLAQAVVAAQMDTESADEAVRQAEVLRVDRQSVIHGLQTELDEAESIASDALSDLHEARMEAVARRERVHAGRERESRLDDQFGEIEERIERLAVEANAGKRELGVLSERRAGLEARAVDANAAAEAQALQVADAKAGRDDAAAALEAAEHSRVVSRRARDAAVEAVAEARLALQSRRLRLEHLAQRVEAAHQLSLGAVVHEHHCGRPPHPDDHRRLGELEALIQRIGEVNLTAIEQCAEVADRHRFLTGQRDDLLQALADLDRAIDQIDRTSRQLFAATFEAVNAHFEALFPRLFRGGHARLELTDPDDLLGTGIDMLVQPPGKRVQNVNLLSGGEKAMCAIALVFAVFQVRPSPFCLLDEVDAPLDDANISRFNDIVREMARMSQIVLITHNKRTMEIADVLYGVTMEEPGISKLVSVRMT